jgi:hypothetical protein
MNALIHLAQQSLAQVALSLRHNWPFLALSILIASVLNHFLDSRRIATFLRRHRRAGVLGATALAVTTPLCSCGTTAVVLGMMASLLPWAPIVAFMVASPLSSPEGLVYSAGLFGWPFALTYFGASIVLGLAGGLAAAVAESNGWLTNQTRFAGAVPAAAAAARPQSPRGAATRAMPLASSLESAFSGWGQPALAGCSACGAPVRAVGTACCAAPAGTATADGAGDPPVPKPGTKWQRVLAVLLARTASTGWRLTLLFIAFAFVGYFVNGLIPSAWVAKLFGSGNAFSVPLAATLGLPLYVNSEASLPLVRAMIDNGVSPGAAMAFLITGAGTSIGAVLGALTIARWRVLALVVGTLWLGALAAGYAYNLLVAAGR